jgi:hypothetical protein
LKKKKHAKRIYDEYAVNDMSSEDDANIEFDENA